MRQRLKAWLKGVAEVSCDVGDLEAGREHLHRDGLTHLVEQYRNEVPSWKTSPTADPTDPPKPSTADSKRCAATPSASAT